MTASSLNTSMQRLAEGAAATFAAACVALLLLWLYSQARGA